MKWHTVVFGGVLGIGASLLIGCHDREVRVVEHRHPPEREVIVERTPPEREVVVVEERPTERIIVTEAPPREIVEVRPPPPSGLHIWIGGFYSYHDHHYTWVHGHYSLPPKGHREWEHDRWEHSQHGWEYRPGHWK